MIRQVIKIAKTAGVDPSRQYRLVDGHEVLFDEDGFLWSFDDWNEKVAQVLAREGSLEVLNEDHWLVIRFLRGFYYDNGRAPLNRQLMKGTSMSLLKIEGLFPGGIKNGARRIAGLPNPKSCL